MVWLSGQMTFAAASQVLELLALVREGAEVLLTEGGTPVAKLTPVEAQTGKRIPNLHLGGWMSDDFDDPLPDEFWLGEA